MKKRNVCSEDATGKRLFAQLTTTVIDNEFQARYKILNNRDYIVKKKGSNKPHAIILNKHSLVQNLYF